MTGADLAGTRRRAGSLQARMRVNGPVICTLIVVAMLVWPIYLLPPGYPQPVSFFFAMAFAWLIIRDHSAPVSLLRWPDFGLLALFVAYSLVVNLILAIGHQSGEPVRHALYYMQALIGSMVIGYLLRSEPFAPRILSTSIVGALVIQAGLLAFAGPGDDARETAQFSNPNQLGFFGLLALACLLVLHRRAQQSLLVTALGCATATVLVFVSLSKAAIISMAVMWILFMAVGGWPTSWRRARPLLLLVVPAVVAVAAWVYRDEIELLARIADRLAQIGQSGDDSFTGRSYVRIALWPGYLLLGAGEGLLARWEYPREIHSMFGTLLFSYGVPGLVLIAALLTIVCRRNPRDFAVCMIPVLLYSLTHHPMRQAMMWALLAAISHFGPTNRRPGI